MFEGDTVTEEYLQATLDNIKDGIGEIKQSLTEQKISMDARMTATDKRVETNEKSIEKATGSRAILHQKIDDLSKDMRETFHSHEHRMDQIELKPATDAFNENQNTKRKFKDVLISKGAEWLVVILLILLVSAGPRLLENKLADLIIPHNPIEDVKDE